jgi:hypothetical protein
MTDSNFIPLFGFTLPILVFAAVIAIVLVVNYYGRQSRLRAWGELASNTGLTCESGGFFSPIRVTGMYRGHGLVLDTFTRSSGKSSQTYTRIVLSANNPSDLSLAIYEEGVMSKIGKALGMQDIQLGDADLDQRFIIKGRPEEAIVNLLAFGSLRQKLLDARSLNLALDGQQVHFEERGVELDIGRLQFLFDLMSDLAEAIERAGGTAYSFRPYTGNQVL